MSESDGNEVVAEGANKPNSTFKILVSLLINLVLIGLSAFGLLVSLAWLLFRIWADFCVQFNYPKDMVGLDEVKAATFRSIEAEILSKGFKFPSDLIWMLPLAFAAAVTLAFWVKRIGHKTWRVTLVVWVFLLLIFSGFGFAAIQWTGSSTRVEGAAKSHYLAWEKLNERVEYPGVKNYVYNGQADCGWDNPGFRRISFNTHDSVSQVEELYLKRLKNPYGVSMLVENGSTIPRLDENSFLVSKRVLPANLKEVRMYVGDMVADRYTIEINKDLNITKVSVTGHYTDYDY